MTSGPKGNSKQDVPAECPEPAALLRVSEAAARLKVSEASVRRYIRKGMF
jgi:DNA-binding MurR/RpiR family transcriptional regulator